MAYRHFSTDKSYVTIYCDNYTKTKFKFCDEDILDPSEIIQFSKWLLENAGNLIEEAIKEYEERKLVKPDPHTVEILKQELDKISENVKNLFERDDIFFKRLK